MKKLNKTFIFGILVAPIILAAIFAILFRSQTRRLALPTITSPTPSSSVSLAPTPEEEFCQIYYDPWTKLEVAYPKKLALTVADNCENAAAHLLPGTGFGSYNPPRESNFFGFDGFEKWYARERERLIKRSHFYTIIAEEKTEVDGLLARKLTYRLRDGTTDVYIVDTYIPVPDILTDRTDPNGSVHIFGLSVPWNDPNIPKYVASYNLMLSSLRFFQRLDQ